MKRFVADEEKQAPSDTSADDHPLDVSRRNLLLGAGAAAIVGAQVTSAAAQMGAPPVGYGTAGMGQLKEMFPTTYDPAYIQNAVMAFVRTNLYAAQRPFLPMIDETLSKENALPYDLWGMLYDDWAPNPEEGLTVFLQGLEKRGPENRRKRIYISALTPDLYRTMYAEKVAKFFDRLLDEKNAGKPLMRYYLDNYFDLFWDLHVGVQGEAVPSEVRQIGESFNTVLGYRDPLLGIVYENYMKVRALRTPLKTWIEDRIQDVIHGRVKDPEKTFVYYWIKNGGGGSDFRNKDVVFESFHNFVALSQWGNTIYNIMMRLEKTTGDADVKAWFKRTMEGDYDNARGGAFTPLQEFVMELFRVISPNGGSISSLQQLGMREPDRHGYAITPHLAASTDPRHWEHPLEFDPGRYKNVPASDQVDKERAKAIGFAKCPFEKASFPVKDGRNADMTNSAFGTVFGVVDGKAQPVCDYAGFAPFGFGYRRCPGELLTIAVFEDFLKKVWAKKIEFQKLDVPNPAKLPIGPTTVIDDNIGFVRRS